MVRSTSTSALWPLILFAGVPGLLFVAYCFAPLASWVSAATLIGGCLLALFLGYIALYRKEEGVSLGSTGPIILGPWFAQKFIAYTSTPLNDLIENGGNTLIQVAFFFAGAIGTVVYLYSRTLRIKNPNEGSQKLMFEIMGSATVLILLFVVPVLMNTEFAPVNPPESVMVFGLIDLPYPTPLTVDRGILALWTITLVTMPAKFGSSNSTVNRKSDMISGDG